MDAAVAVAAGAVVVAVRPRPQVVGAVDAAVARRLQLRADNAVLLQRQQLRSLQSRLLKPLKHPTRMPEPQLREVAVVADVVLPAQRPPVDSVAVAVLPPAGAAVLQLHLQARR